MEFRAATVDDMPAIADLFTAINPDEPWDPVLRRHMWEAFDATGNPSRSYLMLEGGRLAGVAEWWYTPPEGGARRYGRIRVGVHPWDRALYEAGVARMEAETRELSIDAFAIYIAESDQNRPAALRDAGYRADRLQRAWELDLVAKRDRILELASEARRRVEAQGVALTTIAEAGGSDDLLRRIYEVDRRATMDIPTTVPNTPPPFAAWLKNLESPGFRRDRMWIALEADTVLGMSWLEFPVVRGNVFTAWTGVAPEVRGRGLARALKLQTLRQAMELGVDSVRTENDEENAAILHINQELGYRSIPGNRLHVKEA